MRFLNTFILLLFLYSPSYSTTISSFLDFGSLSSFDDYEESIDDKSYNYQTYNLKLDKKISKTFNYYLTSFLYKKDYLEDNAKDNSSLVTRAKLAFTKKYNFNITMQYKQKKYQGLPREEFDQIKLNSSISKKEKNNYRITFNLGFNSFKYLNAHNKDLLNLLAKTKFEKYFNNEDTEFELFYKLEASNKQYEDKKRNKHTTRFSFTSRTSLPLLYKYKFQFEYGQRDTKDIDELDFDTDFTYYKYTAKTSHKLKPRLKTDIKYEYIAKDYTALTLDYSRYLIHNKWAYDIINEKNNRLWTSLKGEYKDMSYIDRLQDNYIKKSLNFGINYKRRKNYKLYTTIQNNIYCYKNYLRDKDQFNYILGVEKYLLDNDLKLGLSYKHRFLDYVHKADEFSQGLRVEGEWRF